MIPIVLASVPLDVAECQSIRYGFTTALASDDYSLQVSTPETHTDQGTDHLQQRPNSAFRA